MTVRTANPICVVVLGAAGLGAILAFSGLSCTGPEKSLPVSFAGSSDRLKQTVIVPTLDTPAPAGKNVIWCASFQLAWDRLRDDLIRQPLQVANAQTIVDRLNAGKVAETSLPPEGYYAGAGKIVEGIVQQIRAEMARRFPSVTPAVTDAPDGLLAYSYLTANIKFTTPYFDRKTRDVFTDSAGRTTPVSTFGLFETASTVAVNHRLAEQIDVLYSHSGDKGIEPKEFALDLCKTSRPSQIVLACVEPKDTLAATIDSLERKINQWEGQQHDREFSAEDILAVPNLNWRVTRHFTELEGTDKVVQNPGWTDYWIAEAVQMIDFRLGKSGANLASESRVYAGCIPRRFMFTRPFLIVMKVRGQRHPYFVMWVGNAELLCKR